MKTSSSRRAWMEAGIVGLVASVPILLNIGVPAIYQWDEARVALNALEMMQSGNLLVITYQGEPDLWNAKPPIAIWLAAGSMKLLGPSELALRLPAALAAIATVIAVALFTKRVSGSRTTGFIAALALLGIGGFVEIHVARTAEYDAFLVLFITLATFSAYGAIRLARRCRLARRRIYQTSAFLIAGLLTKGIAALPMLPGWAAYALLDGKVQALARCAASWIGMASVIFVTTAFFGARELADPGFVAAFVHDSWGRLAGHPEQLTGPWHYYVKALLTPWQGMFLPPFGNTFYLHSAFPWIAVLILIPLALRSERNSIVQATKFLTLCLLGFLLAISAATSKAPWYVAPAYPLIAVLAALSIDELLRLARMESETFGRMLTASAVLSAILLLGMTTAKAQKTVWDSPSLDEQKLPSFLQQHLLTFPATSKIRVVNNESAFLPLVKDGELTRERYDGASEFYVRVAQHRGRDVRLVEPGYRQRSGEVVIGCFDMGRYLGRVIARSGNCVAKMPVAKRPGPETQG